MEASANDLLKAIDTKLAVLVGLELDRSRRELDPSKPKKSLDLILTEAGLSQSEVAKLLGKTRQAVAQMVDKKGKAK